MILNPPPQKIPEAMTKEAGARDFLSKLRISVYQIWFAMGGPGKGMFPPTLTDTEAENGTLYYSSTQGKLVFKNSAGVVNVLY